MRMPIRVRRVDGEICALDAPDHRGEVYRVALDVSAASLDGVRLEATDLELILCRHHLRSLRQTIVEV